MSQPSHESLPEILAGPIVRRLTHERLLLWLVTSRPLDFSLALFLPKSREPLLRAAPRDLRSSRVCLGERAFVQLVDLALDAPPPPGERIGYDLLLPGAGGSGERGLAKLAPHLLFPGRECPDFILQPRIHRILHGSCRKPHHAGGDGLVQADALLAAADPDQRPALLLLTGDQIYADWPGSSASIGGSTAAAHP